MQKKKHLNKMMFKTLSFKLKSKYTNLIYPSWTVTLPVLANNALEKYIRSIENLDQVLTS